MIRDEYPEAFVELGTVDGTLYGFFMKAGNKGTVFYNPGFFEENGLEPLSADASFDDLLALSDDILATGTPPWSHGEEAGGGSGFPGSDWIQQIIINEHGEDVYDGLIDGSVAFTDDEVVDAWEKFGAASLTDGYTSQGSADAIIATNFVDSTYPPFEDPPEAGMVYMGSFAGGFIGDQFPDAVAEEDYDFFPFPGGAITGDANIVYAFDMNDSICSFLKHVASAEAQQIWVEAGGFTSVNENVSLDSYPDPVSQKAAQQLLEAPAFRFDLDDAIGGAVQTAIFEGVLSYLQNPDDLQSILENIEAARAR
jgi:alpha-glucoside transport system substrate-binding protein